MYMGREQEKKSRITNINAEARRRHSVIVDVETKKEACDFCCVRKREARDIFHLLFIYTRYAIA